MKGKKCSSQLSLRSLCRRCYMLYSPLFLLISSSASVGFRRKLHLRSLVCILLVLSCLGFSLFSGSSANALSGNYRIRNVTFGGVSPTYIDNGPGYSIINIPASNNFSNASSPSFTFNIPEYPHTINVGDHIKLSYIFTTRLSGNLSNDIITALPENFATPACPAPLSNSYYQLDSCTMTAMDSVNISSYATPWTQIIHDTNGVYTYLKEGNDYNIVSKSYRIEIDVVAIKDVSTITLGFGGDFFRSGFEPNSILIIYDTLIFSTVKSESQLIQEGNQQSHTDAQNQLNATNAQTDAINQQTEQDKNQYDQEKQEEQDRENQGKDDADKLAGLFNITLLNPFAGIWEMFNAGGCSSISTIASWLGTDQTTYCSWWPQSVRSALTPVFSIASAMILFGFFMRWLGGSKGFDVQVNGLTKGR